MFRALQRGCISYNSSEDIIRFKLKPILPSLCHHVPPLRDNVGQKPSAMRFKTMQDNISSNPNIPQKAGLNPELLTFCTQKPQEELQIPA